MGTMGTGDRSCKYIEYKQKNQKKTSPPCPQSGAILGTKHSSSVRGLPRKNNSSNCALTAWWRRQQFARGFYQSPRMPPILLTFTWPMSSFDLRLFGWAIEVGAIKKRMVGDDSVRMALSRRAAGHEFCRLPSRKGSLRFLVL